MLQPTRASGIHAFRPAKPNNRNLRHRFVALIGAFTLLIAPTAYATFATPGQFDVSPTGAASYTVPIAVPPGTAGMAPSLALNYNSQGGNGLLGMGWSLSGLSAITRCPKTFIQDSPNPNGAYDGAYKKGIQYDTSDKYCLDGQRLVASNGGADGADGTEYRTEREGFSKIVSYGSSGTPASGPAWFKVWTKSGQILEFGNDPTTNDTTHSRIEAQGKTVVRIWAVNKISDTKGNYLTVSYTEDNPNGQYYPSRIDYTGNAAAGLVPYDSVRFVYATRPDITPMYDGGSLMKSTVRLSNVQTWAKVGTADTLVKDYRLAYDTSAATQRSRLISLTECDGAATPVCLQPTALGWQEERVGFAPVAATDIQTWDNPDIRNIAADYNGDGKTDFLVWHAPFNNNRYNLYLSNGNGFNPAIATDVQSWYNPLLNKADSRMKCNFE